MARGGINKAVVQTARLAILARGEHPSIDAVRIEMGNTGSKTTIHRYLKELDDGVEPTETPSEPIDDELTALVSRLAQRLKEQAQEPIDQARAQFDQQKTALDAQLAQAQVSVMIRLLSTLCLTQSILGSRPGTSLEAPLLLLVTVIFSVKMTQTI